jgi:hypothetical protein
MEGSRELIKVILILLCASSVILSIPYYILYKILNGYLATTVKKISLKFKR